MERKRAQEGRDSEELGLLPLVPNLRGETKSRLKSHCSSWAGEEGASETENEVIWQLGASAQQHMLHHMSQLSHGPRGPAEAGPRLQGTWHSPRNPGCWEGGQMLVQ